MTLCSLNHATGHIISHLHPKLSASWVDYAWGELPGDRGRRVSGPEDCLNVGAEGRCAGDQSRI